MYSLRLIRYSNLIRLKVLLSFYGLTDTLLEEIISNFDLKKHLLKMLLAYNKQKDFIDQLCKRNNITTLNVNTIYKQPHVLSQIYQTLTECISYTYRNLTMFLKNSKGDSTASHNIPFKCSPLSPLSSSTYLKPASCSLIGIVFILILPK